MSINVGDVVVKLELDDRGFHAKVVGATSELSDMAAQMRRTARSAEVLEKHTQSLGRRFRDLVITLGNLRFVMMDINDVFLRLPMSILKTAGELERLQQLMTGLSAQTDDAKRKLEGMRDMNFVIGLAKNAPFEIGALADTFVKLKTAGIDPTNGSMQALVDSVAKFGGTGETLKRASIAIQQMAGKGVISMEELRQQLGEAVPTAMKAMADGMGIGMQELAKIVSSGTLKAEMPLRKMLLQMTVENAGAAEEMMQTWSGMTSQLKTEWQLAAQAIASAGFLSESKSAVQELIQLMRSSEFKDFAVDFGRGLGEAVSLLRDGVEVLIKYRSELMALVTAWAAYKAVTSIIAPLGRAIADSYQNMSAAARSAAASISAKAVAERAAMLEQARSASMGATMAAATLASKLENDKRELASVRAKNAAILAESAKLSAELRALQVAEQRFNANNIGEQQRKLYHIEQLAQQTRVLSARERELTTSIAATTGALNVASAAAVVKSRQMAALTVSTRAYQAAVTLATGATKAFSAAVSFMGGPVGVAITAIAGLVWWWQSVKRAADEAREAQRQALLGNTTQEQLGMLDEGVAKASEALKAARERAKSDMVADNSLAPKAGGMAYSAVMRKKTAQEIAADEAAYQTALKNYADALNARRMGYNNVREQMANDAATSRNVELERELRDLDTGTRQQVAKIRAEREQFLKETKLTGDALEKEKRKYNDRAARVIEEGYLKQAAIAEQRAKDFRAQAANASGAQADGMIRAALQAEERAAEFRKQAQNVAETLAGQVTFGKKDGDKGKVPKDSPIQRLIEQLRADNAELRTEFLSLDETLGKGDVVAAELAKFEQRLANGDFMVDGRKPTEAEIATARQFIEANARIKAALKEREEVAKQAQRIADFIEGIQPDIDAAFDLLEDPLGTNQRGQLQRRAEKFIGSNLKELEAYAKQQGATVDSVRQSILDGAVGADIANRFVELAKQTDSLRTQMVNDDREAARARAQADLERHRVMMQNLIAEREMAGASVQEIANLQNILVQNLAARTQQIQLQFRSHIEHLADTWGNTTKNMEEATARWADRAMDAFVELASTGKLNFRGLVDSIIADIIRMNMQAALSPILKASSNALGSFLGGMFGFANGGIMTEFGPAPLKKYARGGIANSPQLALFGEGSMPEAYVPLPDGRTIPVTLKGAVGGGDQVQINITVNESGEQRSQQGGDRANAYRQMAERIRQVVREELISQARPGGMLYR